MKYKIDDQFKRDIFSDIDQYERYIFYLKRNYCTKKHNPSIPPEELQGTDELSDVNQENSEIAHYDIPDTEQQGISSADNIEMDNIAVDLEDKIKHLNIYIYIFI